MHSKCTLNFQGNVYRSIDSIHLFSNLFVNFEVVFIQNLQITLTYV